MAKATSAMGEIRGVAASLMMWADRVSSIQWIFWTFTSNHARCNRAGFNASFSSAKDRKLGAVQQGHGRKKKKFEGKYKGRWKTRVPLITQAQRWLIWYWAHTWWTYEKHLYSLKDELALNRLRALSTAQIGRKAAVFPFGHCAPTPQVKSSIPATMTSPLYPEIRRSRHETLPSLSLSQTSRSLRRFFWRYLWQRIKVREGWNLEPEISSDSEGQVQGTRRTRKELVRQLDILSLVMAFLVESLLASCPQARRIQWLHAIISASCPRLEVLEEFYSFGPMHDSTIVFILADPNQVVV